MPTEPLNHFESEIQNVSQQANELADRCERNSALAAAQGRQSTAKRLKTAASDFRFLADDMVQ